MRKNSLFTSAPEVYTAIISSNDGVEMFTRRLDDYDNALSWCEAMAKTENGFSYKLLDSESKRVLSSGKNIDGSIEKGMIHELEHRELIVEMLSKAGQPVTEEKIKAIAAEIAKVHIKEDPAYYEKLEKVLP